MERHLYHGLNICKTSSTSSVPRDVICDDSENVLMIEILLRFGDRNRGTYESIGLNIP